jgi:hypothetical protein
MRYLSLINAVKSKDFQAILLFENDKVLGYKHPLNYSGTIL